MKTKTFLATVVGMALATISLVLGLVGVDSLSLAFLAGAVGIALLIVGVTHRFIVKSVKDIRSKPEVQWVANAPKYLPDTEKQPVDVTEGARSGNEVESVELSCFGNNLGPQPFLGAVGPKYEYSERIHKGAKLETFALRTRSDSIRDAFARAATAMLYDRDDVIRILRTMRAGKLQGVGIAATWERKHLLALARIMGNQPLSDADLEDAEVIFNAVGKIFGEKGLGKSDIYIYAEVLQRLGESSAAHNFFRKTKVGKKDRVQTELIKLNAIGESDGVVSSRWLDALNSLYLSEDISGVTFDPNLRVAPLDGLRGVAKPRSTEGPKVSIIVPTFEGANYIRTTLDCLVKQTWRNLEIVVVDDGSSEQNRASLQEIVSNYGDDVQLILQDENLGAYPARNRALKVVSGDFVTVHDDDDWSHPEKIEIQAKHLLENEAVPANMSRHARASEDLTFTRINNNPSFSQPNFSSLMIRRSALADLGDWDNVNRGADAEFRDRLVRVFGQPVEVLKSVPLSFTRTHSASLTSGEISRGYIDPSRLFYQSAYQSHHETGATLLPTETSFARPRNLLPGQRGIDFGKYDVVFATDFCFPGGTSTLTLNEVEAAADAGLKVGILHLFSPVNAGSAEIVDRALHVALRPDVDVLSLSDSLDTDLLLVRHPSVLQFADGLTGKIRVARGVVVVNNPPVLAGGKGYGFDLGDVSRNFSRIFGVTPEVRAESGVTWDLLNKLVPSNSLSRELWPGFLDTSSLRPKDLPDFDRKPTLGRHSRDASLKWPSRLQTYRDVYVSNDVYDVRIMGGVGSLSNKARALVEGGAEVIGFNAESVDEYLDSVDFWAYYHSDELTESFGMAAVEAMTKGVVVILPKYMEKNFGEAALYAEPAEVHGLVSKMWQDRDLYVAQSERARLLAERNFGKAAFLRRVGADSTGRGSTMLVRSGDRSAE